MLKLYLGFKKHRFDFKRVKILRKIKYVMFIL